MMGIPLKGNIKDLSLPKILAYLNRNRKTGTLKAIKFNPYNSGHYINLGMIYIKKQVRKKGIQPVQEDPEIRFREY